MFPQQLARATCELRDLGEWLVGAAAVGPGAGSRRWQWVRVLAVGAAAVGAGAGSRCWQWVRVLAVGAAAVGPSARGTVLGTYAERDHLLERSQLSKRCD